MSHNLISNLAHADKLKTWSNMLCRTRNSILMQPFLFHFFSLSTKSFHLSKNFLLFNTPFIMNSIQRDHIRENVHALVLSTDCNDFLLARLRSNFILLNSDIEELVNYTFYCCTITLSFIVTHVCNHLFAEECLRQ